MKLLVCDFDGTYFTNDKSIIKNNYYINKWINDGNLFMISSGRSYKSLKKMTDLYNIKYNYLSCCDGSILYDNKENIIIKYNLNNDILTYFLSLRKYVKIERIQYSYDDDYYPEKRKDKLLGCNLVIKNKDITNNFLDKWNKLLLNNINYDFLTYPHDEITYFCLKNKGINKSTTVKYLETKLNIDYNDIIVFGDNENDFIMLSKYQSFYIGEVDNKIKNVCIKGYNNVYEYFEK